jgi:hypothetical protein
VTPAAVGAGFAVVCVVLVAVYAVVVVRRRRADATATATLSASATAAARDYDRLRGSAFERVRFDGEDPQLVFVSDHRIVLTPSSWPALVHGSVTLRFPESGYRRALSALSGETVRFVYISPDDELVIEFAGASLVLEPRS